MTGDENFIVRLDKICAFVWTALSLFTSGYVIYGLSHLHCEAFNQRDIRPSALFFGTAVCLLALFRFSGEASIVNMLNLITDKCSILFLVPIVLMITIGVCKAIRRKSVE